MIIPVQTGMRSLGSSRDTPPLILCSDFATNVGMAFKTPEEFFLDQEPRPFTRDFDPTTYFDSNTSRSADTSKLHLWAMMHLLTSH